MKNNNAYGVFMTTENEGKPQIQMLANNIMHERNICYATTQFVEVAGNDYECYSYVLS